MFGMTLEQDIRDLEASNPVVRAARLRLDEATDDQLRQAQLRPEMEHAKRDAMLVLLGKTAALKDQDRFTATLVSIQRRGYDFTSDEIFDVIKTQDPDVRAFWLSTCPCGLDIDHVH